MYFWTTIRKNRSKYNSTRGISEDDVTALLLRDVIVAKNPQRAEASLLKLPGLRKFSDNLKTSAEKEHFRRHLRKYINIWLPDCPFEVSTTNRYTIVTNEAATTARRFIKKGDSIKYLCGHLVSITSEEEKDLDVSQRDFSIVMSTRKKTPSLFLGPARFSNHDCDANARLVTQGSEGMQIVAVRNIQLGEEITVTYGDDYFGERNCECLCLTCEREGRNGWSSQVPSNRSTGIPTPSVEPEIDISKPYSFRKIRKRTKLAEDSLPATPDTDEGSPRKKRKADKARSPSSLSTVSASISLQSVDVKIEPSGPTLRSKLHNADGNTGSCFGFGKEAENLSLINGPNESILDEDVLRECVKSVFANASQSNRKSSTNTENHIPQASSSSSSRDDCFSISTPGKMTNFPALLITPEQTSSTPSDVESIFDTNNLCDSSHATTPSIGPEISTEQNLLPQSSNIYSESELSELSSNESFDETNKNIVRKQKMRQPGSRKPKVIKTIEADTTTARYPGDYIRTPLLLGESYSRWVDCRTCTGCWVQQNGYLTRKECPRCERHSKLYGYQWPKTDKLGKGDDEERVMDHRTVHRFIKPEEEALVKKRGRGVERPKFGGSDRLISPMDDASDVSSLKRAERPWRNRVSMLAA